MDHRWRWSDERYRIPIAVADACGRHGHQSYRSRHSGVLQHRWSNVHQFVQGSRCQDELPWKGNSRKERESEGTREYLHDAQDVYVAQTTCSHVNHFYKAVMESNEYPGPAI